MLSFLIYNQHKLSYVTQSESKCTLVLIKHHVMQTKRAEKKPVLCILNLKTRRYLDRSISWLLCYRGKGHWCPLDKKQGGPHTQLVHHVDDKFPGPTRNWTPLVHPVVQSPHWLSYHGCSKVTWFYAEVNVWNVYWIIVTLHCNLAVNIARTQYAFIGLALVPSRQHRITLRPQYKTPLP
jgi:hypothetical protein